MHEIKFFNFIFTHFPGVEKSKVLQVFLRIDDNTKTVLYLFPESFIIRIIFLFFVKMMIVSNGRNCGANEVWMYKD